MNPSNFNSACLLRAASERCGLSDFGDDYFRPALDKYIHACVHDGFVAEGGLESIGESIIGILIKRLKFEAVLRRHPEILDQEIVSPLFILGSPGRVGSTKLHRLLGNATNVQTVPLWQVMNPVRPADCLEGEADQRIEIAEGFCDLIRQQQPQLYAAIQPVAIEPDEDPYLFDLSFMQFMFNATAHAPSYMHWIYEQDWHEVYRYHRKMLQYLQWQNGTEGVPMLLKGPSHTAHLDMLYRFFPDARFVQIHRDPVTCIASMTKVVKMLQALQPIPGKASMRDVSLLLEFFTRHHLLENLRIRDEQPEISIIDFYFEDVSNDAVGVAKAIFEFWQVPLAETSRQLMRDWEITNTQDRLGKFEYSIEDSGVNRNQFEASIAPYMQRFYPGTRN